MALAKSIGEHRSTLLFAGIVVLCLGSLASGARGGVVSSSLQSMVSVVQLPFVRLLNGAQNSVAYFTTVVIDGDRVQESYRNLHRMMALQLQHSAARQELAAENGRLRALLDFQRSAPSLTLQPVQVLQHADGLLIIDRGASHGMRESMCVITGDGVIGLITRVDYLTSLVSTLQNPDCRIDAMVKRSRVRGTVHGAASDLSHICGMQYIDLKDDVRRGDEIVTSPDSVFPSGLPIGKISQVEYSEGSLWKSALVEPAANPFTVDEVFVIIGADRTWEDLAGANLTDRQPETPVAGIAQAPKTKTTAQLFDADTLQERFAP